MRRRKKMKKKEFKIGEEFQLGLLRLKCIKTDDTYKQCDQCFLGECWQCSDIAGDCMSSIREDKQNVVFVKVDD